MNRPLFFNETFFHLSSPVDENQNYKLIRPVIWDCQELYIQDMIGTPLYEAIKDEITDNNGTLTTARFVTLVNTKIAPSLLNYVLMEGCNVMLYKFRNKSIMTDRTDTSEPVDYNTLKYLRDQFREKAEKYAQKVEDYLCANSSTFPEWTNYTTSDQVRAQAQKPTISLYLGNRRSRPGYGWEYYEGQQ